MNYKPKQFNSKFLFDDDLSTRSFTQYYTMVNELQQNKIPVLPSFVNHSQHQPWLPIVKEVMIREILDKNEENEISQILPSKTTPTYIDIQSQKLFRGRIQVRENRKATKEYRQPTKFKYKTFSMPHNFWLKILDKNLIDSKLSPNLHSTRNEQNTFKKMRENWFAVLNPIYDMRSEHSKLINSHANRRKSTNSGFSSKKVRLMINVSDIPRMKVLIVPNVDAEVIQQSPGGYSKTYRRFTKPENHSPKKTTYFDQYDKHLNALSKKQQAPDSRPTSVRINNQQSNNMRTMKQISFVNDQRSSKFLFFPTEKLILNQLKSDISIGGKQKKHDLKKSIIFKGGRSSLLMRGSIMQSIKGMSTPTQENIDEDDVQYNRFTLPIYRIYNADTFEMNKSIRHLSSYTQSSQDRFSKKQLITNPNLTTIAQNVVKKKKKKKLVKSTTKQKKIEEDLSIIQTYFPDITQIEDFKRRQF